MPTNSAAWKELEELTAEKPGELAFRAICGLLDTWPDEDLDAALQIVKQRIESWGDHTQHAP